MCKTLCTAWSHAKCVSRLALGFTHQKGLSYQIFELEDSGLPQQGILPISAKKHNNNGHRIFGKRTLPNVEREMMFVVVKTLRYLSELA